MQLTIDKTFLTENNIFIYSVVLTFENDWNKNIHTEFYKFSDKREITLDIQTNFKIIVNAYTNSNDHINLISEKVLEKNVEIININDLDFFKIDLSSLKSVKGCSAPWLSPVILADGTLTVCCNDSKGELSIGNVNNKSFTELWFNDEKIKKYRYAHVYGDYSCMNKCVNCLGIKSFPLEQELVDEYSENSLQFKGKNLFYKARTQGKKIIRYLMLELSDLCNLSCFYCNQSYKDWNKNRNCSPGNMSFDKFKKFIQNFSKEYFFENIHLFWMGEPLLNPDFKKFLILLKDYDCFSRVHIHTNATLFDQDIFNLIKEIKYNIIFHYSLESLKKEVYTEIKGENMLDTVLYNIREIILRTTDKSNITNVIQFIVNDKNIEEVKNFQDYWKEFYIENSIDFQITSYFDFNKNNIVYFRFMDPLHSKDYNKSIELFTEARKKVEHLGNEGYVDLEGTENSECMSSYCFSPFEYLCVRHDGNITFCCHDTDVNLCNFNIFDHNVDQFNDFLQSFFRRFLNDEIQMCKSCEINKSINIHKIKREYVFDFLISNSIDPKTFLLKDLEVK